MREKIKIMRRVFMDRLISLSIKHELPKVIRISYYSDLASLQEMRPDESWQSAEEHSQAMDECINEAIEMFPSVEFQKIELDASRFRKWLKYNNLKNDPSTRAMYINQL